MLVANPGISLFAWNSINRYLSVIFGGIAVLARPKAQIGALRYPPYAPSGCDLRQTPNCQVGPPPPQDTSGVCVTPWMPLPSARERRRCDQQSGTCKRFKPCDFLLPEHQFKRWGFPHVGAPKTVASQCLFPHNQCSQNGVITISTPPCMPLPGTFRTEKV
jgi:hypothetical protein